MSQLFPQSSTIEFALRMDMSLDMWCPSHAVLITEFWMLQTSRVCTEKQLPTSVVRNTIFVSSGNHHSGLSKTAKTLSE